MAFDPNNPPSLIASGIGGSRGLKAWAWRGTDPIATVIGSGYIRTARKLGMGVGDSVRYVDGNDDAHHLVLSAIDADTGYGTVSFPQTSEEAYEIDASPSGEIYVVAYVDGVPVRVDPATLPAGVLTFASQAEAEAGSATDKPLNSLRTKQSIEAQRPLASQAEAEAGAANTQTMTPLRVFQAIAAFITGLSTKATPVDADGVVITDSGAGGAPKRVSWLNVKATLKTYFDTLYGSGDAVPVFATKALAEAYAPASAPSWLRLEFYDSNEFLNSGALYRNVGASEPTHDGKIMITLADAVTDVWFEIAEEVIWTSMLGADPTLLTDQSAVVQKAIDVIGARGVDVGGLIENNRGVRFNWNSLNGVRRFNMAFWRGDDKTPGPYITSYVTNERVMFMANADVDGIVNEERTVAPYHPSRVTELYNHVDVEDSFLGTGQNRIPAKGEPVYMSNLWKHSGTNAFYQVYALYGSPSRYNSVAMHTWWRTVLLQGVDQTDFTTPLVASGTPSLTQHVVRGVTSGAIGWLRTVSAGFITVHWIHGIFQVGEQVQLVDNIGDPGEVIIETSTTTITAVTFSTGGNPAINFGIVGGAIGLGTDRADFYKINTVACGFMGVEANEAAGQRPFSSTTLVRLGLADNYDLASSARSGRFFEWDLSVAAADRRLTLKRDSDSKLLGHVGAVAAHGRFTHAGGLLSKAFNVASVTASGGKYDVLFTTALASANYTIFLSEQSSLDNAKFDSKTVNGFSIYVYDNANPPVSKNASFEIDFMVVGGDI